jgi:prepilin-type N-terminal cleavage/methylation domain-containing protein/prepilin-type processing-associated H-X9-DG protein
MPRRNNFPKIPTHLLPRGFSLVEMLVVVAILGLLVGLSVPVIGKARAVSQQVGCTANLRTLHQATLAYAGDYDGYFPVALHPLANFVWILSGTGAEPWLTSGYLGLGGTYAERQAALTDLFNQDKPFCLWCPSARPLRVFPPCRSSYAMNIFLGGMGIPFEPGPFIPTRKIIQVVSPSKTALYMDGAFQAGSGYTIFVGARNQFPSPAHPPNLKNQTNNPAASVNVVFVDGHVEMRRLGTIPTNFNDPFWNPIP